MTGVRLKVLVTAILVSGGLSLSAVSGLFNTASGQPPATPANGTSNPTDPNFRGYGRLAPPVTDGDAEVEKARAEVEKARRALERATEDLFKRQREAEDRAAKPAGKFEYVPVPKNGFTPEEFEKKIAEHEQKGWHFSGEATIRLNQVAERVLVFRNTVLAQPGGRRNDFAPLGGPPQKR